jgi:putative hydrolase of the HAD superfamily
MIIDVDWIKNIQAVVFDIGGTLLDFERKESYAELKTGAELARGYLLSLGHAPPPANIYRRRIITRLARAYLWSRLTAAELDPMRELTRLHRSMGISLDDSDANEVGRLLYSPNKALAHAHPDTVETLRALRAAGMKIGLISNTVAPPSGIEDHLAQEGLLEFFAVRVYSCRVGVPKPNPKIFRAALQELDVGPERALYIGDKPHIDIVGSHRVGMYAALRANQMPTKEKHRPDILIGQLGDLLGHFKINSASRI